MKITKLLLLALAVIPGVAGACWYERPPEFAEVVKQADKIFIARILDQRVTDRFSYNRPVIEGRMEIVETILGEQPAFEQIEFSNGFCGGVRLDVNHHYVVFTAQSGNVLKLVLADNSMISIESEYIPGLDRQNYKYPFLKSVRAFAKNEASAESIDPFPNIERNGTVKRIDCDPCRLYEK